MDLGYGNVEFGCTLVVKVVPTALDPTKSVGMKIREADKLFSKDFLVFIIGVAANVGCNLVWFLVLFPPFKSELIVFAVFIAIFSVIAFILQITTWLLDPGYLEKGAEPSDTSGSIYMPPIVNQLHDIESGNIASTSNLNQPIPVAKTYPFVTIDNPPSLPESTSAYSTPITVNGVSVVKKYCTSCSIWRPLRASHCSECDYCVERHDHHCPWMANCIGRLNYPFFYFFSVFILLDCVTVCATTAYCLVNFEHVHLGVLIALTCFTGLLCWPLIGLSGYHTYLIARNVTTHEDIKFQRRRGEDGNKNPFDLGSLTLNCHDTLVNPCKSQSIRTFEDQ